MRRIIFTVTNDLVYDQRMERICSTLAENGYVVTLVGRLRNNSPDLPVRPYRQKRIPMIFSQGKMFYLEYNIRLFFYLLFAKTDIIGAVDLDTLFPCYLTSRLKNKKIVYDAHEYFTEVIEVVERPLIKKAWKTLEKAILPKLQYAYTVCESLKRLYEAEYKIEFEVIRNVSVLNTNLIEEKKTGDKYIIYAGAVNEGRGLDECIEAMAFLDVKLMVCGDGDILDRLKTKVDKLQLNGKVIFTGYLTPDQLREKIRTAWLGVLLLENKGLSYYYSLANKFFDYIHAGIPQMTVDFPEYKILNQKHEVALLTPLGPHAIANNIKRLSEDYELYQKLADNTRKARLEWNWQKESQKLLDFYNRVSRN